MFELIICIGSFYIGWKYGDKVISKIKAKLDKTNIDEKVIETVEAVVEAVIEVVDDE